MTKPNMEIEYIQGTRKRKLQLVFLLLLVAVCVALSLYYYESGKNQPLINILYINVIIHVIFLPIHILIAQYCYRFGRKVYLSRQYPPPDSEFPFTMKVQRGNKTIFQAYSSYALALLILLFGFKSIADSIYMVVIANGSF